MRDVIERALDRMERERGQPTPERIETLPIAGGVVFAPTSAVDEHPDVEGWVVSDGQWIVADDVDMVDTRGCR
jgi:hypothetical protein